MTEPTSKNPYQLLVIDDDDLVLAAVRTSLPEGWTIDTHLGVPNTSDLPKSFDAALVDVHLLGNLSSSQGPEIMAQLKKLRPSAEVIAMSGDLTQSNMESCLEAGASRFLAKPLSHDEFHSVLSKVEAYIDLLRMHDHPKVQPWIGTSERSQNLRKKISLLKNEPGPILIEGNSGTGKEVIAHLIHQQEGSHRPMVSVNVAAIPEHLFESELFGHNKGAFTGADQKKMGLIEAADGGDLFLDEIEALALPLQAKLLRFLENQEIRRVGSRESRVVSVRVIAATNHSLDSMAEKGTFRDDLLWRLNGKKISLPNLSDRIEDIPVLIEHFSHKNLHLARKTWQPDAIELLCRFNWPGNVRQLRRVCEQISISAPLPIIRSQDVSAVINVSPTPTTPNATIETQEFDVSGGLSSALSEIEAKIIRQTIERNRDIDATAKLLRISRSGLYKKIKDHRIEL